MVYDLVIIGNGIFANVFLHEINQHVNKSQNFKIAKVYSEELAPNCSLRTTSTVSQNGIEEGVSHLGDLLLKSYLAFEAFHQINKNCGIYPVKQFLFSLDEDHHQKLSRRYQNNMRVISHSVFPENKMGIVLDSYIVVPEEMFAYFHQQDKNYLLDEFSKMAESIEEIDGMVSITFSDKSVIKAKKVLLATGAYSRINTHLFAQTNFHEKIKLTKIVAGSYLIKKFDYPTDLYFTINGHNLVYRKSSQELIIGSTSVEGAVTAPDLVSLKAIFETVKSAISLEIGSFSDYQVVTGLRHKGQKRMPFFGPITKSENIWFFNGAYKNGWSLPFYLAKEKVNLFI